MMDRVSFLLKEQFVESPTYYIAAQNYYRATKISYDTHKAGYKNFTEE
jgi:hypothetical protein